MSSKQPSKKRGRINVVACNKCKRDKKKCDGSYLTQKPCKYCRDRDECCEYTEPNRLRINRIVDNEIMMTATTTSNINEIMIANQHNQHHQHHQHHNHHNHHNHHQNISTSTTTTAATATIPSPPPSSSLQQSFVDNELCKSDLFLQLLTDPSTTIEQMNILKRLYNEVKKNPGDANFIGNKRDELCMKLKLLSSTDDDDDHTKNQVWGDLCSLVNELDKMITENCGGDNNSSVILDSLINGLNSWNSETLAAFSSNNSTIAAATTTTTNNNNTTMEIFPSGSTTPRKIESQQSNLIFSNDLTNQLNLMNNDTTSIILNNNNNQQLGKNKNVKKDKKQNNIKKRKTRKNQKGNKRTQPYPAGGQIVIRPTKQAHTMIWHQNDPLDDVPIMAFQYTPPTPPPVSQPPQRTQFQQPQPPFAHFQPIIPVNLWDHSTTMTMLSPKPNSCTFSEPEINNEPITNSILLSPTPSLHDDIGDIVSSPSNSSIIDHVRVISDDEKDHFGLISLTQSTGSPRPQSPPIFTMEDIIEMWSNSSSVTEDLVEPIWNCR